MIPEGRYTGKWNGSCVVFQAGGITHELAVDIYRTTDRLGQPFEVWVEVEVDWKRATLTVHWGRLNAIGR